MKKNTISIYQEALAYEEGQLLKAYLQQEDEEDEFYYVQNNRTNGSMKCPFNSLSFTLDFESSDVGLDEIVNANDYLFNQPNMDFDDEAKYYHLRVKKIEIGNEFILEGSIPIIFLAELTQTIVNYFNIRDLNFDFYDVYSSLKLISKIFEEGYRIPKMKKYLH